MTRNQKTLLIVILVIIALCCCCMILVIGAGAGGMIWYQNQPTPTLQTPRPRPNWLPTDTSGTPVPSNSGSIPPETAYEMDVIEDQVVDLRGLDFKNAVNRGLLTTDELRAKVEDDFFKDYTREDSVDEARLYSLFGWLNADYDLYSLYINLYSEQIAGYYDNITKEMYVIQGKDFTGAERMTYAHEFTHVLQDQNYDIQNGLKINDEYCETHSEYCYAVQALIEGDATVSEQQWLQQYATLDDRKEILQFYASMQSPVFDSAPKFLTESMMFPYLSGMEFVQALYDEAGWRGVDAAYQNPPVSSEQILHPDLYPSEQPQEVNLPDIASILGTDWRELDSNEMGEYATRLLLTTGEDEDTRIDDKIAAAAAAGWGGDAYTAYWNDSTNQGILAFHIRWDSVNDAREFTTAFEEYGGKRFSGQPVKTGSTLQWDNTSVGSVYFIQSGADTLWLIAPDDALIKELRAAFTEIP